MNGQGIWTRRDALGLGIAAAALTTAPASAAGGADTVVIEWNQHMFSSDVARFPFNAKAHYKPDPAKLPVDPVTPYLARLADEGIDRAVFVQPEPYGDDHSLILDCLRRTPSDRFKGTSLFYPKDPNSPEKLTALIRREPRIVSTRFHKLRGNSDYFDTFADDGVRALWKRAVDLGLVIELHIGPQYGLQVSQAIAEFPGCKVLIDHLAEPETGNAIDYANVLDLARFPNVYMKMSELENMAKDPPFFESLIPFTRRVIEEFGPERTVWSGGSPRIADMHMTGYTQDEIAKVKGGNIRRLLNW